MPARNGYTLIELLVAISIVGLLSLTSIIYYKTLSADKAVLKAVDSITTLLRTAQSNAATGFACNGQGGATSWSVEFDESGNNVKLKCLNSMVKSIEVVKSIELENVEIQSEIQSRPCYVVTYSALFGKVSFTASAGNNLQNTCTVTLQHSTNTSSKKSIVITNGGAINAQ